MPKDSIKFEFVWEHKNNGRVEAVVTRKVWRSQMVINPPDESRSFLLYAEKGATGMSGIDGGYIPWMSEKTREWLYAIARTRLAAALGESDTYHWEAC